MYECVLCHLHLRILLHTSTTQHPININSTDRVIPTEIILGRVDKIFCFGILHEPSPPFSVVHSSAVVRERQAGECLIFLAVEPVSVIRNRHRRRYPAFTERLVVVAFENLAPRIYDRAHAAQMVRQEITDLGFIVDRPHDPPAAERRTLEYSIRLGTFIRTICKRTSIRETAVVGILRREFRIICKIRIFCDNRRYLHRIIFFIPLSLRLV